MFQEAAPPFNFPEMEKRILQYWKNRKIFAKSLSLRKGKKEYIFYEGPPTANGVPHPGHVLTRVVKDLFPRYKTMCGFHVNRKAGWDTHGLPVEIEVEKQLGLKSKTEVEKYGIEPFIKKCKESVFRYKESWEKMTERIGFWINLEEAYVTYTTDYVESVWWALKQIWEKDLLYKSHKIIPWCPRCGTGLSSHEVGLGYKTVKDPAIHVAFRVKGQKNQYLAAWTTTPWTLLSNVALAVGADFDYAYVEIGDGDQVIMAKDLVGTLFEEAKILKTVKGKDLVGLEYEPLFSFAKPEKSCYRVVTAGFVSLSDGTGIVHIAPAFGEDDYQVGLENDLPVINMVNDQGEFIDAVTPWKGQFVKKADKEITKDLKKRHLILKSGVYEHEYPFCWRCDTPLLYYARPAWFIKTTKVIKKILKINDKIGWYPDHIKHGRFGKFLEANRDWALSRERFWGTPLPIWECTGEDCQERKVMESIKELTSQKGYKGPKEVEPHKPYIDDVTFPCPKCKSPMKRVSEVIDCWFDSGAMPFAQWGYPHKNRDKFDSYFPADFISEALDQTRGWFYTLLMIHGILFEKSPYKNCLVLGLILGEDGRKMSKKLGNYIEPTNILDTEGADAMRWYFYSSAPSWNSLRFFEKAIRESQKDFLIKIWNCYSFFTIYANLDKFDPRDAKMKVPLSKRSELDQWILSEFQKTLDTVRKNLDQYHIHSAALALIEFVDSLSNWYIRRSRSRFWKSEKDQDKWGAYSTLYECLVELSKVIAPFVPFISEEIYQNLVVSLDKKAPESVHLCDYPKVQKKLIHRDLMDKMAVVREIVTLGHNGRMQEKVKVRQPLPKVLVVLADQELTARVQPLKELIQEELNVKEVVFLEKATEYVGYRLKPNFKVLGPKYGKQMGEIQKGLSKIDTAVAYGSLSKKGEFELKLGKEKVVLLAEEVQIELFAKDGFTAADGRTSVVVLDIRLTEELILEGLAREVVNRIQKIRKDLNLSYDATISTTLYGTGKLQKAIETFQDYIEKETLTRKFSLSKSPLKKGEKTSVEKEDFHLQVEEIKK